MNGAPAVQDPGPVAGASPVPDPVPSPVVEVVAAPAPAPDLAPAPAPAPVLRPVVRSTRARSFLTVGLFLAGIAAALLVMSLREDKGER